MKFGKQSGNEDTQTTQKRYNQQVSAFAQAIARELPDFRLVLEKSKLGRFVATLTYNKDYSPIRYTVPRNEEAGKARQPGWFMCSFCRKAKPQSEYLISLDSEKCCKSCGKKHPKWVENAREYEKDPATSFS